MSTIYINGNRITDGMKGKVPSNDLLLGTHSKQLSTGLNDNTSAADGMQHIATCPRPRGGGFVRSKTRRAFERGPLARSNTGQGFSLQPQELHNWQPRAALQKVPLRTEHAHRVIWHEASCRSTVESELHPSYKRSSVSPLIALGWPRSGRHYRNVTCTATT